MLNAWNNMVDFFRVMEANGSYYGLGLLAVLFCLMYKGMTKKKTVCVAVGMSITLLPFLAYVGMEFFAAVSKGRKRFEKWIVALALLLVIMVAGTVVPWSGRKDIAKRAETEHGSEYIMTMHVQEAAAGVRAAGQEPLLVAPKEIMESVRLHAPEICLVYGRDLWEPETLSYLHESYPAEVVILCQSMESAEGNVAETVEMALAQGCNLVVCREPLTVTFTEYHGLECYAQESGFYLYVR